MLYATVVRRVIMRMPSEERTSFLVSTIYLPRKQADTMIISSMEMMKREFDNTEFNMFMMFDEISAPGMSESRPFHIRI